MSYHGYADSHLIEVEEVADVRDPFYRRWWRAVRNVFVTHTRAMTDVETRLVAEKNALVESLRIAERDLEEAKGQLLIAERHEESLSKVIASLDMHVKALTAIKASEVAMAESVKEGVRGSQQTY